tara:strand:+ start:22 stop:231 length:210 start_codon:yes stop_codon:yes gene_type:complete
VEGALLLLLLLLLPPGTNKVEVPVVAGGLTSAPADNDSVDGDRQKRKNVRNNLRNLVGSTLEVNTYCAV